MPRLRSLGVLIGAVLAAVGMIAVLGGAPAQAAAGPGWRGEMLAQINAVRAAAGVPPVKPCPALRRSAQQYATVMSTHDHFGHVGPEGSQPVERVMREGYRWRAFAENIAAGQRTVTGVMAAWVASPGHYANLVNPAYRHVGLGHASTDTGSYGDYWVQDFGRGRGC
jgi:uncharacterized protein YkwD